ncbi:hypothetical protein CYMTET_50085 [Cymbomonas tetramitiformis]|uniref:Choloylglycine hydrolase/NAAA C-terminal domain-containing protein n=1 Tax=Cymbomonas tetramitiformis TaxID=36881 RepID=A0AAE0ETH7_9CHLO|nr:hypothetical protein CYMTET_50085 [Cymbomonas tetramitiformis]
MEFEAHLAGQSLSQMWTVNVHPRDEIVQRADGGFFKNLYGWVGIDLLNTTSEGMNEHGLTASAQTFRGSQYQSQEQGYKAVYSLNMVPWLLGNFKSVDEVVAALGDVRIVQGPESFEKLSPGSTHNHWTIVDKDGRRIILEYVKGLPQVHNDTVGIFTNDPVYDFHLQNVNQYAFLSDQWPSDLGEFTAQTEVGTVPQVVGHGFNLRGLPGDYSPASRFIRMFYLKQFSTRSAPPADETAAIEIVTGINPP